MTATKDPEENMIPSQLMGLVEIACGLFHFPLVSMRGEFIWKECSRSQGAEPIGIGKSKRPWRGMGFVFSRSFLSPYFTRKGIILEATTTQTAIAILEKKMKIR